jgi:hypothetical protein
LFPVPNETKHFADWTPEYRFCQKFHAPNLRNADPFKKADDGYDRKEVHSVATTFEKDETMALDGRQLI